MTKKKIESEQGSLAHPRQHLVGDLPATLEAVPEGYASWLRDLKARVHEARQRAARSVNQEMVRLYWQIGRDIHARQETQGWGAKIVDRISADLKVEFPDTEGFSPRNLKYMRAFAVAWPDEEFVQGVLAQLPWYSHLALLDKLDTPEKRRWYAQKAIEHGWSRNVLVIKAGKFKPEHLGQLGFYCTAVDAQVKAAEDAATIGLLHSKSKNEVVAEYALRTSTVPLGIAGYQLTAALPKDLEASLPSIDQIERELGEVPE